MVSHTPANYGQLQVAGTVTLNGVLSVDLLPGFSPTANDTFTVLTAGTRNGSFNSFFYPSNAVTMQLSNTANSVIARVTGTVPPPVLAPTLAAQGLGGDFKICWTATSNAIYRVEFSPDLTSTNWTSLPGDITATNTTACFVDPLTSSNRFYRVRVLP